MFTVHCEKCGEPLTSERLKTYEEAEARRLALGRRYVDKVRGWITVCRQCFAGLPPTR